MEIATIAAVIERYGAYNAALERDYIRSQQIAPEPPKPLLVPERSTGVCRLVAVYMATHPGWQRLEDITAGIGEKSTTINAALTFWRNQEKIDRMYDVRGRVPGTVQRYRWRQA